jgi:hypothetical protein
MSDQATDRKPILVLDFDGVLHSYTSGWQGPTVIPDPPVEGAVEFCDAALEYFDIRIVSSRCKLPGGPAAIWDWLIKHGFSLLLKVSPDGTKPAAFVTIDDRAITFMGTWPEIEALKAFKPWNKS